LGLEDLWLHGHLKLIALGVSHIVKVERSQQTLSLLTFNDHFVHYIQLLLQDIDMNLEVLHQLTLATTSITIHWEALRLLSKRCSPSLMFSLEHLLIVINGITKRPAFDCTAIGRHT